MRVLVTETTSSSEQRQKAVSRGKKKEARRYWLHGVMELMPSRTEASKVSAPCGFKMRSHMENQLVENLH